MTRLMIVCLEESIVDHLNVEIPIINAIFMETDDHRELKDKAKNILRLIGRYSPASAFEGICLSIIEMKSTDNEELAICGLTTFRYILEGHLEALPPGEGLLDKRAIIEKTIAALGSREYLDGITKHMLAPFTGLFELVFGKIVETASNDERAALSAKCQSKMVRIAMTALSMPIFLLVTDDSVDINYKLVKASITNTARLADDADAKYFLRLVETLVAEDYYVLVNELNEVDSRLVSRSSNDMLMLCSTLNYYLFKQAADSFQDTVMIFECAAKQKDTMAKLFINITCYINFYVLSVHPGKRTSRRDRETLVSGVD